MFAATVRGNTDASVIGEEATYGYYGPTGHASLDYRLPHTGIVVSFLLVDPEQEVPRKAIRPLGRSILPDYPVAQSAADFLANRNL